MEVVVATHSSALAHDTGPGHPESPDRVLAARKGLDGSGVPLIEIEAPLAQRSVLALAHDPAYIGMIEKFCSLGGGALDMDTVVSSSSWEAALRAVGGVVAVVEELESRSSATGFALTRPPGHHAARDRAMGFCVFNNVAVAALLLRSRGSRVAILDWDVHHGNGTQAIVGSDPDVLYVSLHQDRHYPLTGRIDDIDSEPKGSNVNIPLPAGTAGDVYRLAWSQVVLPVVAEFSADWVLVSAGYDAHVEDPLAGLELTADDFGWLAGRLHETHPPNRTVVALEGGYDLIALEQSVSATIRGLSGAGDFLPSGLSSPPASSQALADAAGAVARHWRL